MERQQQDRSESVLRDTEAGVDVRAVKAHCHKNTCSQSYFNERVTPGMLKLLKLLKAPYGFIRNYLGTAKDCSLGLKAVSAAHHSTMSLPIPLGSSLGAVGNFERGGFWRE